MRYTWLLFDADDTLFDFPQAEADALRLTFEELGLPFHSGYTQIYKRCNQQVWEAFERGAVTAAELRTRRFALLFEEIRLPADPQTVSPVYLRNLSLGSRLLDGAETVIRALGGRYRLALVTNGLAEVQRPRLARSPLRDAFAHVFISEEIGAAKPHRDFFDHVFRALGNPPKSEVLLIGDSLTSDMAGGIGYGIDTCWYNPNGKTTDLPVTYEVRRLQALAEML
ncbi:MAG: YjjG family noncanonical pyrimidine nucleotidase [Anaerolineales bacterium]